MAFSPPRWTRRASTIAAPVRPPTTISAFSDGPRRPLLWLFGGSSDSDRISRPASRPRTWRAMSACDTMPTSWCPSITGRRRTPCLAMVEMVSLIESSAPMVTGFPSASSLTRV